MFWIHGARRLAEIQISVVLIRLQEGVQSDVLFWQPLYAFNTLLFEESAAYSPDSLVIQRATGGTL